MQIHHKLIEYCNPFFKSINRIKGLFKENIYVRVLLYHSVSKNDSQNFRLQLESLKSSWDFITPDEFWRWKRGEINLQRRSLLVSFDDGFYSTWDVAKPILDDLRIKCIFFIITDYLDLNKEDIMKKEILKKKIGCYNNKDINNNDFDPLDWEKLKILINEGHEVGSHTVSHPRLTEISNKEKIEELRFSKIILEKKLSCEIKSFAYPFGDINSIDIESLEIANRYYKSTFSGIRGKNYRWTDDNTINRDSVQTGFSPRLVNSLLEGAADWLYIQKRVKITRYANDIAK